jgi:hypothetical protein
VIYTAKLLKCTVIASLILIAQSAAAGWGPTPEWCKVNADPFYCEGMNHVPAKEILSSAAADLKL